MEWETVIGLEIHAQLATNSKIFSGSSTAYGAEPNTQASLVDLGMPGVLPVLNKEAVHFAVKFGLAVDAHIAPRSVFARKNYFYPDLPKGYQISQYELPIVGIGHLDIELEDGSTKRIGITRAHLEEDAGKSLHEDFHGKSGIDLNRAGTPLLEIVSEPDMRSAKEAVAYLKKLHALVRYLGVCDGNMQEGSFRCDANVSVRKPGQPFGTRAELKNLNSFRFIERAINIEVERQIDIIESGGKVVQETRLYDPDKNETRSMRGKEDANDYRYFPDPDLLPVEVTPEFIESVRASLPELPDARKARLMQEKGLQDYDAELIVSSKKMANYFDEAAKECTDAKGVANWMLGDVSAYLNNEGVEIDKFPISPKHLGEMVNLINKGVLSSKLAKKVFAEMLKADKAPADLVKELGLEQVSDTGALQAMVDEVIAANPQSVADFKAGKDRAVGFLVGQIMKQTRGKANPKMVNKLLNQELQSR